MYLLLMTEVPQQEKIHFPIPYAPEILKSQHKMQTIEFSLDDLHWIQWIQWIMPKPKNGLVARGSAHLVANTLPVVVMLSQLYYFQLEIYPLPGTTLNGIFFFIEE